MVLPTRNPVCVDVAKPLLAAAFMADAFGAEFLDQSNCRITKAHVQGVSMPLPLPMRCSNSA
jgi:hypothetical protein